MPSPKTTTAVRIARSLPTAELAINEAAIGVLTVGTEVLRARTSGTFGPLEGQGAVDNIGRATAMIFGALTEMANAHTSLRDVAADHQILSYGDLCPPPFDGEPTGEADNVTSIRAVA